MIDIKPIFKKELVKSEMDKDRALKKLEIKKGYFRDSIRRQLNKSNDWQLTITYTELRKELLQRGLLAE